MTNRNTAPPVVSTGTTPHMRGIATRPILITLLVAASAFMAYRLLFVKESGSTGSSFPHTQKDAGKAGDMSGSVLSPAPPRSPAKGEENGQIDPSLRLDLLNNSRAVSYTGSKRNIFVLGAAPSKVTGSGTAGGKPIDPKTGNGTTSIAPPPPPLPPPPVVIPLKFYGIAERSGTAHTKALLTSGDTILIAQTGQTVAQHFKILRIGLTKLELEDIRDHSTHDIPLEEGGGAASTAGSPASAPPAGLR